MKDFVDTHKSVKKFFPHLEEGFNFENELIKIEDKKSRDGVLDQFITEFNSFFSSVVLSNDSWDNMTNFFLHIAQLIDNTENTIESMSKINIFTLNYDDFIEKCLSELGVFCNVINPSK